MPYLRETPADIVYDSMVEAEKVVQSTPAPMEVPMSKVEHKHLPLVVSELTPSGIKTAAGNNVSVAWADNTLENPYSEAEQFAAFIVRACNAHDDLVKALEALLGGDEKMKVGIGGNPNYVGNFIAQVNAALSNARGES